jgi:2-iminobutanoate/2-iminopropanoate deaminase
MILRAEIYLKDMKDFSVVNRVYGSCFDLDPPARITVEVAELPMGAKVEISAVALRD